MNVSWLSSGMPLGRSITGLLAVVVLTLAAADVPGKETEVVKTPSQGEVERFVAWLREEGLLVRERVTKGRSVMAACGQLGNPEARARRR